MNCGIKTFNRFTPLAPDIHTPNKDDAAKIASKVSLITVLPTAQIIHRRRKDQINQGK